jgi:hypothetical protein
VARTVATAMKSRSAARARRSRSCCGLSTQQPPPCTCAPELPARAYRLRPQVPRPRQVTQRKRRHVPQEADG